MTQDALSPTAGPRMRFAQRSAIAFIICSGLAPAGAWADPPFIDKDVYRGTASARLQIGGTTVETTWDIEILRFADYSQGIVDRWSIGPRGAAITRPDGTKYWIASACSSPEPAAILGATAEFVAGSSITHTEAKPWPGVTPLSADVPATVRAPVYPLAIYRPQEHPTCDKPIPSELWAEITYMVGPGFHNALDRQRVAWFSGNEEHEKTLMTHWDVHNDSDVLSAVHAAIVQGHVKEAYQLLAILTHHGEFQSLDIAGGALLLNERQFSEAIKYFRRAIVVVPEDAKGYELLADAYLQLGRNAEALPLADRAVVLTTGNGLRHDFVRGTPMDQAQAFNLRAHIEENLGRRDDALADYRQEVTLGRLTQDVLGRLYPEGQPSRYCDLSDSLEGLKRLGAGAP